jgi:hypothetical protein
MDEAGLSHGKTSVVRRSDGSSRVDYWTSVTFVSPLGRSGRAEDLEPRAVVREIEWLFKKRTGVPPYDAEAGIGIAPAL